jgi:type VI secretion system secreted protein VgrG
VYNGESKPPYSLPDEKNVSTIKSNSTTGGGGCNEIRIDDTKDEEQLLLQAQKRLDVNVKGSRFESVGGNRHLRVGGDKHEFVKGSRETKVETDDSKDIDGDKNMCVLGNLAEAIQADHTKEVGGKMHYHVTGAIVLESDAKITLKVGGTYLALDSSGITAEGPVAELKGTTSAEVSAPTVDVKADGVCTVKGAKVDINP